MKALRKIAAFSKWLCYALAFPALLVAVLWGGAAIWFDGPSARPLAGILSAAFVVGSLVILVLHRPVWRAMSLVAALLLALILWWNHIPPSNNRDWQPDVARLPRATINGSLLTINNVRNFDYHSETDFTERWETRTYNLDQLRGADMFLSFWGPTLIAHTIVSWDFEDGQHLAISIETRKEKGESYSAIRGFFRQFELYYVVADERDLIGVRTNFRGEHVYLYRMRVSPEKAKAVLLDYMKEVNRLTEIPCWYNALTNNCTTAIRHHAQNVAAGRSFDWRILANGRIDELGYERGQIDTSLPFAELKVRSEITEKAKAADGAPDFSARIRENLPGESRNASIR